MRCLSYLLIVLALTLQASLGWTAELNINTASAEQLAQGMKGIGPHKAEAIVLYRQQHGPFDRVEDLTRVRGIGDNTVEINRTVLSVGEGPSIGEPKTDIR